MTSIATSVLLLAGSVSAGYVLRLVFARLHRGSAGFADGLSVRIKRTVLICVNPLILALTFWAAEFGDPRLRTLPLLGLLLHFSGAVLARGAIGILRLPPRQAGSFFACGMFSNLGFVGGLFAFLLFGERGYVLLSLFRLPEQFVYYLLGYPLADFLGNGRLSAGVAKTVWRVLRQPPIFMPLAGIATGLLLQAAGIERTDVFARLNQALIPVSITFLLAAVGLSLRPSSIRQYGGACTAISLIRFACLPVIVGGAAFLLGYGEIEGGLPLNLLIMIGAMPVAFNALVPPALFNLDQDLANACWLVTMAGVLVLSPLFGMLAA